MIYSNKTKKCLISVSNDIVADHRVHRTCSHLIEMGYEPILWGRSYSDSPEISKREYTIVRPRFIFRRSVLFYIELQLRLFFYLLRNKSTLIWANDLDTLLPNFLIAKLRRVPLIYDSHECFTEMPEVNAKPFSKKVWLTLERILLKKLPYNVTVCQSIAQYYHDKYQTSWVVVRNVPPYRTKIRLNQKPENWPFHAYKRVVIYQGALNEDRGLEELIVAMKQVDNAVLIILGDGRVLPNLKDIVKKNNLENTVFFLGYIALENVRNYTPWADLGVSLEKNTSISYYYCLPNKLFDYIQARLPVLVSPLPEMSHIVTKYDLGRKIDSYEPQKLAQSINEMLNDAQVLSHYKQQAEFAAKELCWEREKQVLTDLITRVESDQVSRKR